MWNYMRLRWKKYWITLSGARMFVFQCVDLITNTKVFDYGSAEIIENVSVELR